MGIVRRPLDLGDRGAVGGVLVLTPAFNQKYEHSIGSFNGLILLKDDIVVYKLTGGQPAIQQTEENQNPLGPVQAIGSKVTGISF